MSRTSKRKRAERKAQAAAEMPVEEVVEAADEALGGPVEENAPSPDASEE